MQVYELQADANRYQGFVFADERDVDRTLDWFDGKPLSDVWRAPRIADAAEQGEAVLPASDFPSLYAGVPVFSRRAVDALCDMLEANGELLPLAGDDAEYFALNVMRVVDALDERQSVVRRFTGSNRVMTIERYEFIDNQIVDLTIFKIPQLARSRVYVTTHFVERIKREKLTGFRFVPVWAAIPVAA